MIIGAATSAAEINAWARASPTISTPRTLIGRTTRYTMPAAMISVPMMRTTESGSSRNFRPKTRPAIGMAMSEPSQMSDSTMPRSRASRAYLRSRRRLNWPGTTISANPTTPIPVASA